MPTLFERMAAMARGDAPPAPFPELVPAGPGPHPSAAAMRAVGEALRRWQKPALVLFGDANPIFPPDAAARLAARIPGAGPGETVSGAGHFLQEDEGEEIASRVAAFIGRVPLGVR